MFIHLHNHSPFSFLDGSSSMEAMVSRAANFNMPALALTDHNNLCGAVKFHKLTSAVGIKPIIGTEITLAGNFHLVLLAKNPQGYKNICKILTAGYLSISSTSAGSFRTLTPQISVETLKKFKDNLFVLSACRKGEIPSLILKGKYSEAKRAALKYIELFGKDNFFIELQQDFTPGRGYLNKLLAQLAVELKLNIVATNNNHYAHKEDYKIHDLLGCIKNLIKLKDVHPERPINGENYLKAPLDMLSLFKDYPEAIKSLWEINEQCEAALILGKKLFPSFSAPAGLTTEGFLRELTYSGALQRYGKITAKIKQRLEHELDIICKLDYQDYFLLVWDIVQYARQEKIRYAGRGSAADSAVAFCLYITEVDSIGRNLLFERFMSLERAEKPDIDIDFDARYRDKVSSYVYQKYGSDKVATVCTYNTYHGRSAIRDLGRAMDFSPEEIDAFAKRLPHIGSDSIKKAIEVFPELRNSELSWSKYEELINAAEKIADFPRFIGTHLGGLVVCKEPLSNHVPLQYSAKGVVVTQYDKNYIEDLGLVKLDLLSLRTFSAIQDSVDLIKINENNAGIRFDEQKFDYEALSLGDQKTYQLLREGNTLGVFQLESPAQRALQSRLKADNIEDVVASLALIRPGPIKGNMVEPYIARRHGLEKIAYSHPKLKPILEKTYGVVLFQEQVIEIATAVAGFTPGEADKLRRVMTHARSQSEMISIGEHFTQKAVAQGVDETVATEIFSYMAGYASYGFCEAHAAAFATTAYKTAFLSKHHPAEFFASLLSHQPLGYYPPNTLCVEARNRGVNLLSPDVNLSQAHFTVEKQLNKKSIRVSLKQVKGISQKEIDSIITSRREGFFASIEDFTNRIELSRDTLENLILSGAFDSLTPNRRSLLWSSTEIKDFSYEEKLFLEYKILGINVKEHFMSHWREKLKPMGIKTSKDLKSIPDNRLVKVAGLTIRPHRPPTKSGKTIVFLSLEDEFGLVDITIFNNIYQKYGTLLFSGKCPPLIITGTIQRRGKGINIIAKGLEALDL